jgi:tRNA nucleotidyltransferase (CCA-adding enzyme)
VSPEGLSLAKRAHVYPQVDPSAAALVNAAVVSVPARASVSDALAIARRRNAIAVEVEGAAAGIVMRADLGRAIGLGLRDLPAERLSWRIPVVEGRAGEVRVRRLLADGAPLVVVRERGTAVGAILGRTASAPDSSMHAHVRRALTSATCALLLRIGVLAEARGGRAFLVGGVVRDMIAGAEAVPGGDLDIVVEGNGLGVARLLAAEVAGTLVEHDRFLTASVRGAGQGRIDVATARSERYEAPGALPHVMPSAILQDLRRRDFTINAMAVELSSGTFGLLDPLGGRSDLARRRIRVLHPLSFVEDPTRVFRAARYAVRLGFALDAWTTRCQALAVSLAPHQALSGQRLMAELGHLVREPRAAVAAARLGTSGALRLLDPGYRFSRGTAGRLATFGAARAWTEARAIPAASVELLLLILLGDQPPDVAKRALGRLGITGEPLTRLLGALTATDATARRLRAAVTRSAVARLLRGASPLGIAWLWVTGDPPLRDTLNRALGNGEPARPWLSGDEVIELGVARGPGVARILEELRDGRLDGTITDRSEAVAYVRRRVGQNGSDEPDEGGGTPEARASRGEGSKEG